MLALPHRDVVGITTHLLGDDVVVHVPADPLSKADEHLYGLLTHSCHTNEEGAFCAEQDIMESHDHRKLVRG